MLTEQRNQRTLNLDQLSTLDLLKVMSDEDAKVTAVVQNALPEIERAVEAVVLAFEHGGRLIYIGAGTSGRLGVLDVVECVPTFGVDPGLVIGIIAGGNSALTSAAEGAEDRPDDGRTDLQNVALTNRDVVVGIAASGQTPYVLGAVQYANEMGAVTAGISCNQPAPLLDAAQIKIALPVGAEVLTGSTRLKAGTAQKMALNMLSTAAMVRVGKVYGNLMVDVQITNQKLAGRARRIVSEIAHVSEEMAAHLLEQTNNNVKAAIVVALRDVTPAQAQQLILEANGKLRSIIG
jgi:N-acetylmuramic acid 6-phosphate etherase